MNNNVTILEKLVSAGSYATGGLVGIIWQIACIILKKPVSKFMIFNIYQSIFLSIFLYIFLQLANLLYTILVIIPFINRLVSHIYLMLGSPVFYGFSVIQFLIFIIYTYLIVFSLLGKFALIPWVSKIIMYQINRF